MMGFPKDFTRPVGKLRAHQLQMEQFIWNAMHTQVLVNILNDEPLARPYPTEAPPSPRCCRWAWEGDGYGRHCAERGICQIDHFLDYGEVDS